jgi:hypothetical protein
MRIRNIRLLSLVVLILFLNCLFAFSDPSDNGNTLPKGNALFGITYGNGTFVAVGISKTILTSPNGVIWINAMANGGGTPLSMAEKNGRNDVVEILRQHGGLAVSAENKVTENVPQPPTPPAPARGIQIQEQIEPLNVNEGASPVNPGDAAQIIEKMKGAKSWPEMASLAKRLMDIGQLASKETLKAFQDKNNEKMFRKLLSDILGDIKDKNVITGVVQVLQDEKEDSFVRIAAAQCLGTMGYSEASEPLIKELPNGDSGIM